MYRLLVVHDVHYDAPNGERLVWAYARRSDAIKQYAPPDFHVETCQDRELPYRRLSQFDVIFHLDYTSFDSQRIKAANPRILLVTSFNADSRRRSEMWQRCMKHADLVIANNREVFDHMKRPRRSVCISNGVCGETFAAKTTIEDRPHKAFWRGSSGKGKNWNTILQPAMERLRERGFDADFAPIDKIEPGKVAGTAALRDAYDKTSYVVCASDTDASPNFVLESAFMGAVPVTVRVGNLQEFAVHDEHCVYIDYSIQSLIDGLEHARANRCRLSANIANAMQSWSYGPPGNRAAYYFAVFRAALLRGPKSVEPFYFGDLKPEDI